MCRLLIESGKHAFDGCKVWLVTASEEAARQARHAARRIAQRTKRVRAWQARCLRRGSLAYASRKLDNSGDQTALFKQVDALYRSTCGHGAIMGSETYWNCRDI
jgi:dephospho-CoA kinase